MHTVHTESTFLSSMCEIHTTCMHAIEAILLKFVRKGQRKSIFCSVNLSKQGNLQKGRTHWQCACKPRSSRATKKTAAVYHFSLPWQHADKDPWRTNLAVNMLWTVCRAVKKRTIGFSLQVCLCVFMSAVSTRPFCSNIAHYQLHFSVFFDCHPIHLYVLQEPVCPFSSIPTGSKQDRLFRS